MSLLQSIVELRGIESDVCFFNSSDFKVVSLVALIAASLANSGHHVGILKTGFSDTRSDGLFLRTIIVATGRSFSLIEGTSFVGVRRSLIQKRHRTWDRTS